MRKLKLLLAIIIAVTFIAVETNTVQLAEVKPPDPFGFMAK